MPVTGIADGLVCATPRAAAAIAGSATSISRREILLSINHELQQIAVRIAEVRARALRLTSTRTGHRAFFDAHTGGVDPCLELRGRAVPDEAEISARRRRGRRAQRLLRIL